MSGPGDNERSASEPDPETSTSTSDVEVERLGRQWWFVPVMTFVVGVLLGGVVVGATRSGGPGPSVQPTASTSPTGAAGEGSASGGDTASGGTGPTTATVVVPAQCLRLSDDATTLNDLVTRAVTAVRDLDAATLSGIVRELDSAQTALRTHADACRQVQGSVTTSTSPATSTAPATSPSTPSSPTTSPVSPSITTFSTPG